MEHPKPRSYQEVQDQALADLVEDRENAAKRPVEEQLEKAQARIRSLVQKLSGAHREMISKSCACAICKEADVYRSQYP